MHCRTRVGDDEHDVLRAVGVNVLDHQHGAVLRAHLLILPEVSTERQYVPPSLLLMNAELMSCRWSQLSQLSEM